MKKSNFIISCLLLFLFPRITTAIDYAWLKSYNGGENDRALHVTTDGLGNAHVAGVMTLSGSPLLTFASYSPDGTLLFRRFGNTFLSSGNIKHIERDGALGVYVLCQNSTTSFTLIKYTVNGVEKWRRNYADFVVGFQLGNGGGLYVSWISSAGASIRKIKTGNGNTQWTRSISDNTLIGSLGSSDFTLDPNDNAYFGGSSTLGSSNYDYRLVKVSKNNTLIYNIQYSTAGSRDEELEKITANGAGELFVVGDYDNYIPTRTEYNLVKFSASGALQWHTLFQYSGINMYYPVDVQVGPDGNVVALGNYRDFYNINISGETQRVRVTKFNASTGSIVFNTTPYDSDLSNTNILEDAVCLAFDNSGDIYYGGNSNTASSYEDAPNRWMITKVSGSTGSLQWVDASVGVFNAANQVNDIFVTSGKDVYAAATEFTGLTTDFELVKYCQVGCFGLRTAAPTAQSATKPITVFPNPSAYDFRVLCNGSAEQPVSLRVLSLSGQIVLEATTDQQEYRFGENLTAGTYFLIVEQGDRKESLRIVKTE